MSTFEGADAVPVYLDWAATAPLSPEAARVMREFLQPGVAGLAAGGGNANSLYKVGRDAFSALEAARRDIARAIGASRPAEITFTSGATEANNTAVFGLALAAARARGLKFGEGKINGEGAAPAAARSAGAAAGGAGDAAGLGGAAGTAGACAASAGSLGGAGGTCATGAAGACAASAGSLGDAAGLGGAAGAGSAAVAGAGGTCAAGAGSAADVAAGASSAAGAASAAATDSPSPSQACGRAAASVPHFVTSAIEHDSVLNAARELARRGFAVTYVEPDADGFVQADAFAAALRPNTVAASVQLANSETGAIQPVLQMAAAARAAGVAFHTDATQALGKVFLDVAGLGVDAASVSAHKVGGPKGVGALYVRAGMKCVPLLFGGGQESGRRSGTQNVAGAVAFAAAARAATCDLDANAARMRALRDQIYDRACGIRGVEALVDVEPASLDYLPNICCLATPGIESQTAVLRFDALGVCVSGGSACSARDLAPSHVLRAMGIGADKAQCELRVSLGATTTQADIDAFFDALQKVIDWNY